MPEKWSTIQIHSAALACFSWYLQQKGGRAYSRVPNDSEQQLEYDRNIAPYLEQFPKRSVRISGYVNPAFVVPFDPKYPTIQSVKGATDGVWQEGDWWSETHVGNDRAVWVFVDLAKSDRERWSLTDRGWIIPDLQTAPVFYFVPNVAIVPYLNRIYTEAEKRYPKNFRQRLFIEHWIVAHWRDRWDLVGCAEPRPSKPLANQTPGTLPKQLVTASQPKPPANTSQATPHKLSKNARRKQKRYGKTPLGL